MLDLFRQINWTEVAVPIIQWALAALVIYILPFIVPLTPRVFEAIKNQTEKVKNDYARGVLRRLNEVVGQKVLAAENTAIENLKEKAADGKLTKEELDQALKEVKAQVWADIKSELTAEGIWKQLLYIFGGNDNVVVEYIAGAQGLIEAHVASLPPSGLQTCTLDGQLPAFIGVPEKAPAVP
jgi:hypothetical protein